MQETYEQKRVRVNFQTGVSRVIIQRTSASREPQPNLHAFANLDTFLQLCLSHHGNSFSSWPVSSNSLYLSTAFLAELGLPLSCSAGVECLGAGNRRWRDFAGATLDGQHWMGKRLVRVAAILLSLDMVACYKSGRRTPTHLLDERYSFGNEAWRLPLESLFSLQRLHSNAAARHIEGLMLRIYRPKQTLTNSV
jgi:hypothetical protein